MGARALEEDGRSLSPDPRAGLRVRAFFGLPVPDPQRGEVGVFVAACAAAAPDFRWTPTANLHLTVRFAGNVDRALIEGVAARLVEPHPASFDVELGQLGTFRRGRLARVVWLGLGLGAGEVTELAAWVESECVAAGLSAEERAFQPHLTLGRARHRDGSPLPELPPVPRLAPWRATELTLYSSRLTRQGAVYEPLLGVNLE